jgi:hypothetical protein|tara:strand:+ start:280 stop:552 length:273 start_codon:yes stop_codon:yes gene_type:complete
MEVEELPVGNDGRGVGISTHEFKDRLEFGEVLEEGAFVRRAIVTRAEESWPIGGARFFGKRTRSFMKGQAWEWFLSQKEGGKEEGQKKLH